MNVRKVRRQAVPSFVVVMLGVLAACGFEQSPAGTPFPAGSSGSVSAPVSGNNSGGASAGVAGNNGTGGAATGGDTSAGMSGGGAAGAAVGGGGAGAGGMAGAGGAGGAAGASGAGGAAAGAGGGSMGCEGVLGHPTQPCNTIPTYPGVTLKFVDDFDAPIDLDTDPYWTYSDGFSDQAQARFVKSAISFAEGNAQITMNKPNGGAPTGPSYAEGNAQQYPYPFDYASPQTSGELRTKYNNFKYGYYEFRIKPPVNNNGNFIAAAFVFRTPKWQDWRELDIELQAAGKKGSVPTNVIVGENQGGWSPGISDALDIPVNFDTQADFHTYGFEWQANSVKFYIDRATSPNPVRTYNTGSKLPIPNKSGKIMINFWLFPSDALGGGNPGNNQYPMVMKIDYVRFYKSDSEPFYPCTPTPACLSDDAHKEDLDYSKNNATDGLPTSTSGL
jgi:beta-glucanase (GH16 family)